MAQTATGLTKEQLEALRKDLLSKGLMLNPDGTVTAVKTGNKTLDESYTKASEEYNAKLLEKGKADNKDLVAKRFCSEFMQMEEVPKPFIDKMHHILSDFTEILEKFLNHADSN